MHLSKFSERNMYILYLSKGASHACGEKQDSVNKVQHFDDKILIESKDATVADRGILSLLALYVSETIS